MSVPLPSDVYGAAPSLYIPLPARHFSSMSKSELALVIKLQLSQLQNQSSDSHHNDTFYSSVMEMRTKGRVSKSLQQLPPILHHRAHQQQTPATTATGGEETAAGTNNTRVGGPPLYFKPTDSTLGRLQSSSLKKPKKLMELASADQLPTDSADDGRSPSRRRNTANAHSSDINTGRDAGCSVTHCRPCSVVVRLPASHSTVLHLVENCSAALEPSLISLRRVAPYSTQHAARRSSTNIDSTLATTALIQLCWLICACWVSSGFLALIAFEEADAQLRGLPPPLPPSSASAADPASSALEEERSRMLAVRHHCMVALLDQLDVLSLPPLSFPPDIAFLRSHLLHMLYSVGKGRLLLLRCLMRLPHPHTFDVVGILASNLATTCTPSSPSRVDEQFAVYWRPTCCTPTPMHTANIAYSHFVQPSAQPQLVAIVKSKMGCMSLQVLAKKGQDMRHAYNTAQQQQQQPQMTVGQDTVQHELTPALSSPPSSLSGPTVSSPRLSSVSADFAVWSSLTGELLRLLNGQWAAVFSDLPNNATNATVKPASASAPAANPHSPPSLASARAMWDLVALLLSHITATASHTPADQESEQAQQQLASLIAELRPLMHHHLTATYQLDASGEEEVQQQSASSAVPAVSPMITAVVVAAAAGSGVSSPPRLLPLPHSSLVYACSVLLPADDTTLPAAQTAHRQSEERVRAFIAAKQARLSQQYGSRQRAHYHSPSHHGGSSQTAAAKGQSAQTSSQHHAGHNGHAQQQRRGPLSHRQPRHPQQQSNQPTALAQQTAMSKSQPGSYAFAAAGRV